MSGPERDAGPGAWVWVGFVLVSSLGLSRAFACVTPFAAVAVAAALTLPRAPATALVLLVWLGNQAIGFGLMHYPPTASTFGWGAAIGLAAVLALGAALGLIGPAVARQRSRTTAAPVARVALALVAAHASYELALAAATLVLPSAAAAFTPGVVLRLFCINAVALALLLAAHRLAAVAGLPVRAAAPQSG